MARKRKPKKNRRTTASPPEGARTAKSVEEPIGGAAGLWRRATTWGSLLAKRRQREIGILCGVLAVAFLVGIFLVQKQRREDREAWERLAAVDMGCFAGYDEKGRLKKEVAEGAIQGLRRIEQELGTTTATPWILFRLGVVSYEQGEYGAAIEALEKLVKKHGKTYAAQLGLNMLGHAYEEKGDFAAAARIFEQSATLSHGALNGLASYEAGRCYEALRQENLAHEAYRKAVEKSPGTLWARIAKYRLSEKP